MRSIRANLPHVMVTSVAAVALAAGAVAAEVAAAGPAAAKPGPVLAFTPSPDGFGVVTAGQTASRTLTLANTGGSAARALTVVLSGPAAFAIIADTCGGTSLGAGKSCTVTVQFTPASSGTVTATLTAASKKSGVSVTDALTGTGTPGAHLYWASFGAFPNTGTIDEANLDGTGVTTLVPGQDQPEGVAVDSSHIYWSDTSIFAANLDGASPHTLITGLNSGPAGVAVGPQ